MLQRGYWGKIFIIAVIISSVFLNFPSREWLRQWPPIKSAKATTFSMQTGYYIGTQFSTLAITGLGFRPDLVIVKAETNAGIGMAIKSSAMPANTTQYSTATANDTNTMITLNNDGFTLSANANVSAYSIRWVWVAFGGSDCVSADSTFCVGTYTGNGTATTGATGFQPDLVVVKDSAARSAMWKSSGMPASDTAYLINTNNDTSSTAITSLDASGFSVGNFANVNTNTVKYYFFAFKEVAGYLDLGSYTGNGADNRNITSADNANTSGLTFQPDFVWVKNSNGATAVSGVFSITENNGDYSQLFTDTGSSVNSIQSLISSGGFQAGSSTNVNENTKLIYYVAFNGASSLSSSGTYKMAEGTYVGAVGRSVSGLGFAPNLVLIKSDGAGVSSFKTSLMPGASTAYFLYTGVGNFSNGVTLASDGFSLGTSVNTNTTGTLYYYQAFGNAWSPYTFSGASDFTIGAFTGNNLDDRTIARLPWQPQFLVVKKDAGGSGAWRTSAMSGDIANFFNNAASASDFIQTIGSDNFQAGANFAANAIVNYWFAFRTGSNLAVNSYTGDGQARSITAPTFKPDLVWVKKRTGGTARTAILHPTSLAGDNTHYFDSIANFSGGITGFVASGFSLGADVSANEDTYTFDYVAIKIPLEYYQSAYRFFANADSTDVGSALADQNTGATLSSAGDAFRLRMLMKVSLNKMPASYENFKLQFVDPGSGSCDAPSGGTPAVYTDVTADTIIAFKDNAPTDGDALTPNANDPTLGTQITQTYEEANNFTNSQAAIPAEQYGKWDFSLYDHGAAVGTDYCFRLVRSDDTVLSGYTVYPTITTAATAVVSISISPGGSISFGNVALNSATDTTASPQTITVDSGPANLNIRTSSFTDGANFWTISNNAGDNQVVWQFQNGSDGWQNFLAIDPTVYTFDTGVAQGASRTLSLRLTMPTTTTSFQPYSANVTVTATTP